MWQRIASRVAHLPFLHLLFYQFVLHQRAPSYLVRLLSYLTVERYALYARSQIVACVLLVCSNAYALVHALVVEPVLALDVVCFLLLAVVCRSLQRDEGMFGKLARDARRHEVGSEQVLLLTVEINLEFLYVVECSEGCRSVRWLKLIAVSRVVPDEVDSPPFVWRPACIVLVINEVWTVFALCVECS